MRRNYLVLALALAALVAGCGSATLSKEQTAQVAQAESKGQAIVRNCMSRANFLTPSGRKGVLHCMAPPGQEAAFASCAEQAITRAGFLTRGQRTRLSGALATCVEAHR